MTEGKSVPGTVAPSVGTLRAVVLLVHAADAAPDDTVAGPDATIERADAWFRAVSYGRLGLTAQTLPRWLALPARSAEYVASPARYIRDAVAAADAYVDFSQVDVVYLSPSSRTPETRTFASLFGFDVRADGRAINLWIPMPAGFASEDGYEYLLLHETGHLLGLPDLYIANVPPSFHRWDVMAARYPSELLAWHRWKLGWLDASQIACVTGRRRQTFELTPLSRSGGRKAVFVMRGARVLAVEVRDRSGLDRPCETGVLAYEVDQTPFRRSPVRIYPAQGDDVRPPALGCSGYWNAPLEIGRREVRRLHLPHWGVRVELLARLAGGGYRVRVTTRAR